MTAGVVAEGGVRKAMAWLHTWAGLSLGWVLYFLFFTGTVGFFDTEVDRWMQPELPPAQMDLDAVATADVLLERVAAIAPGAERWLLRLPTGRNQPHAGIFWQGASTDAGADSVSGQLRLDAISGTPLQARDTGGGQLLYQMHWRLHYMDRSVSDWIISFATVFMLVGLVSGVIIHRRIFLDFFTFRPGKGQRSWLDAHNVLSVISLPFQFMITYSGLVFMGFSFMPLIVAAFYGTEREGRQEFFSDVFDPPALTAPAGMQAPMVALQPMIAESESRWGPGGVEGIDIRHPGDRNARVILSERSDASISGGGARLVFDGATGELLYAGTSAYSPAKGARDLLTGLHEGLFARPLLRWLYFLSGLLGTGMVASGLVLWTRKRRQRVDRRRGGAPRGLILVEKLNVGTIAGLPVGVAVYFWANRLLPATYPGRAELEAHALFLAWLVCLVHAGLRRSGRAWPEQFAVAGLLWAGLPLLNALTTDRHLGHSLATGDWIFAGFDITALALGTLFAGTAWAVMRGSSAVGRRAVERSPHTGAVECH